MMREYTFTFRNRSGRVEAEFSLPFDSDDHAQSAAREFMEHSRFPILEVKHGAVPVCQLGARRRKPNAA
jgi:hypothetical protein